MKKRLRSGLLALGLVVACSNAAGAADGERLDLPIWSGGPFVLMLLGIAVLPLAAPHFWERNRNKAIFSALMAAPVVVALLALGGGAKSPANIFERPGAQALLHASQDYLSFIILLASLYTISGGIVLSGDIRAKPLTNVLILAIGAALANVIGTTGASMLLIRPLLQINSERRNTRHLPVFFIYVVGNLGGLLTPLGDPPLLLGFLHGIRFTWTLSLWPHWLLANGIVLTIFAIWDSIAYRRESPEAIRLDNIRIEPIRVRGLLNVPLLAGILLAVGFQSAELAEGARAWVGRFVPCPNLTLRFPWGDLAMIAMAGLSLGFTPSALRKSNAFTWKAIVEVAVLFAGIFLTMVPALGWIAQHGDRFGVTKPWQYFWLTGGLSSVLDNAPTYLTFATLAAGPHDFAWLMTNKPLVLAAISTGAVFMGAVSYIGNGPNFMVKAIADESGLKTPSFFGYLTYSGLILIPTFIVVTLVFFVK